MTTHWASDVFTPINAKLSNFSIFQSPMIWSEMVTSTNDEVLNYIRPQEKRICLMGAASQSKGRGQFNRSWDSPKGDNLLLSFAIPNSWTQVESHWWTLAAAYSVSHVLNQLSVKLVNITLPNDVMVGKRKIAGILFERSYKGASLASNVLGLGVNIKTLRWENEEHFIKPPTSCAREGVEVAPWDFLLSLLDPLKESFSLLEEKKEEDLLKMSFDFLSSKDYKMLEEKLRCEKNKS